ncbi:MATE family efflux transporter [Nesterenkonia haasae]|uniref:MATE family efflux transporter n=1 Tax=Nesterenkonia haasae TaxID=2587813 RepID=UPI002E27DE90|nr:MATE family efflux transporter [Nesterenkonia haasae]
MTESRHSARGQDSLAQRVREVASVSWPLVAGSAVSLLTAVADTAILGQYDTIELSVMARAVVIFIFCTALLIPIGTAVQIVGAQWYGAEDTGRVARLLTRSGLLTLTLGVFLGAALFLASPWLLVITGATASPEEEMGAIEVLRILALCIPAVALSGAARGWLGAQSRTKVVLLNAAVVNLGNIAISITLVFGLELGAQGAAWGTTTAHYLGLAVCLALALHRRRRLDVPDDPNNAPVVRPLGKVAWPDVVFGTATYGGDMLIVSAVAVLGAVDLAGYRIASSTVAILFTVAFTCGSGISILVGHRLGARDFRHGLAYARAGALFMGGCVGLAALPVLLIPERYVRIFSTEEAVIEAIRPVLILFWLITPLIVASIAMAAVVRAVGDTKAMMYIGIAAQLVVALPAAWLLGVWAGWGLFGVVLALGLSWLTRTLLTIWRLRRTTARFAGEQVPAA